MTLDAETPEQPWAMPAPGLPWSSNTAQTPPPAPVAVPVAWLGRTSDEDAKDPTLSLPRQLRNARAALPPGWVIVAHFYDVESGRKELDQRGHGTAHERFAVPIPRDGGIADLLEEAKDPGRRFAAVICESIERVARRTYPWSTCAAPPCAWNPVCRAHCIQRYAAARCIVHHRR